MSDFVTQVAWSRRLGVSVQTFREWRGLGLIPEPADIPGWPRWSQEVVERTTAILKAKKRSLFARRDQRPLQSGLSRPVDGQGSRKAAHLSRQSVSDLHAGESAESVDGSPLHSVEHSR